MKLEYEYLRFDEQPHVGKTKVFDCRNRCVAIYSAGCLRDIAEFIEALMAERRQ